MSIKRILSISLITTITILYALPLYLALVNTFKTQDQILYQPIEIPNPFTLDNLRDALTRPDNLIYRGLVTSLAITVVSVILLIILSSAIGYYLARNPSRLTNIVLVLFMAGLMIPPQIYLISIVQIYRTLGLIGSGFGLILVFVGGGLLSFGVFVYTGFVKNIPRELDEAAILDGAGEFRLFWQIIFPLMRPATATVAIFLSLWVWNDFLFPLILLGPARGMTITTGLYIAIGQIYSINYGQMFAMMALASLPVLFFYFGLQKEFIAGLTGGALKG
ncbi:carbohydrate ABC transporter permease [Chloroflexi bacterium TSY]|nr:carbohydrate ABC transporter permease [Chloroflexi bacterium TSY]